MNTRRVSCGRAVSCVAVVVVTLLAADALAQVFNGVIVGTIVDQTGQALRQATVKLDDAEHTVSLTVETDGRGEFRAAELRPGAYSVTASAAGFRTVTRTVPVQVDSTTRVDFRLAVAAVTETVDVAATVASIQTTTGERGMVLDQSRIESLPLNRRDFLQLALLTPGVEGPVDNSELSSRGAVSMHANGAREEFNDFLLDGVDNNDPYVNRYVVQPSVDSIQEFKVVTNGYSAEYGRNAGGQVNVVTRRGTEQMQGSVYEYFRDKALNARNYFEPAQKEPFSRNQFGGGIGGPIVRNHTYFFGALDGLREDQGLSRLATVPSVAVRQGNLSSLGTPVTDPFNGAPFAGNIIPAPRISPLARSVLQMFPVPNTNGAVNFLGEPTQTDRQGQGDVRIDHRVSDDDLIVVRYADGLVHSFEPFTEGTGVTSGYGDYVDDRTWNVMAEYRRAAANGSFTNSLRFGGNGFSRDLLTENHATDVGALWGVSWLNVAPQSHGYPIVDVAGYSRVGDAFTLPIVRNARTYQVIDDVSTVRGAHLLKFGGEVRHIRLDSQTDIFSRGQLSFTGAFTGTGIGDLLLGLPTFGIQAQADNPIHMRTNAWSAYVQDDWRTSANLTVDLGLRYEYVQPPVDERNGMSIFNPANGTLVQAGANGASRSGIAPDRNNLAPRIGLSWTPARGTVVSVAYGVFYESGMLTVNTSPYFNPPFFNLRVFVPSASGLLTLANPFPLTAGFVPPPTLSTISPDFVNGYLRHWNTAVQRELPSIGSLVVAYAGSKGSNLVRPLDLNQPALGPGDLQARRPYPQYGNIFFVESTGRSRFDSLQVTFDRPLARHMSILAAYTLARSNDDASAFLGTPADTNLPQNSRNPGAEWGPSSYDVRHRLAFAYIVQLPDGNRWTRHTQVEGITVMHTGQPFTPILRFDNSNTGNDGGSTAGSDRPNQIGDPQLADPTADRWFNTDAFVIAAPNTFGNAGRNSVRGPGFASFDVALSRDVRVAGRRGFTFAVQVFNLFNRTNFDLPEHFVDEPTTFGKIFSAKAPRQVQLTARMTF